MRLIKMLGLAAVAAVAAMAFLGASSAMAGNTLLCLNNTASLTPTAGECNTPTSVHYMSVGKNTLLTPSGDAQCEALIKGNVTSANLAAPVTVNISELNYFNCTATCTMVALTVAGSNPPRKGTMLILKTAAGLTSVVIHELLVFKRCFFGVIECEHTGVGLTGHGLGATATSQDHLSYANALVQNNGIYPCPRTTLLDALFASLPLQGKIYIRS